MEERYYDSSSDEMTEEEEIPGELDADTRSHRKPWPVSNLLLAAVAAALVVVVMITVWFWERPQSQRPGKRLKLLERRIDQLEERAARLNGMNERVMALESQGQKFMTAVDRLDRFETAITMRMDILAKEVAGLQPPAAGDSPSVKESSAGGAAQKQTFGEPEAPPSAAEESMLHTVSAGETLYSISRRYDVSVDELRKANQLQEDATIYPGQKLKVR